MPLSAALAAALALQAAAAPAPVAAPPDAERLALSRQLLEIGGGEAAMRSQMLNIMKAMQSGVDAQLAPEARQLMRPLNAAMEREMVGLAPALTNLSVRIWAENLTADELRELVAFQSSPAGRAIARKSPAIVQEIVAETMPLVAAETPKLMREVIEHVCAEQHCSSAQHAQVVAAVQRAMPNAASSKAPGL